MEWLSDPSAWLALGTLTILEIVLGIDNIVFLSIVAGRLPEHQRARARRLGLLGAMFMRIGLLLSLSWLMRLTQPLFSILKHPVSGRDLILLAGGLFLLLKSTTEIHQQLEGDAHSAMGGVPATFGAAIAQIMVLDIIFSLDSVITAIGLADDVAVMVTAIVIAVLVMMWAAGPVGSFVDRHPTIKMLALSFLILIGVALIADGLGFHIPKGYIYFAIFFSLGVEMLNLRARRPRSEPVHLHSAWEDRDPEIWPPGGKPE